MSSIIDLESSKISALVSRPVLKDPTTLITIRREEVKVMCSDSKKATTALIKEARGEIKELKAQITALSPLSTLKRGYAVIQKSGKLVADSKIIEPSDELDVTLAKGELTVSVLKKRAGKGR